MTARKIPAEAADGKQGMTLDEVAELVQRARAAGATGREVIVVTTVGFGKQRIRTARVTVESGEKPARERT